VKRIATILLALVVAAIFLERHRQTLPAVNPGAPIKTAEAEPVEPPVGELEDAIASRPSEKISAPAGPYTRPNTLALSAGAGQNDAQAVSNPDEIVWALRAQAATNADAALAAALKIPAVELRNRALEAVCFGLSETNPAAAVALAQSLHLDDRPGAVLENLVQQWASADVSSALAWAKDQPAGEQRDALITRAAMALSRVNPSDAAALVADEVSPGATQDEAVVMVVQQWGNQDLVAAAGWVSNFPDTPLRERALEELEGIQIFHEALTQP